MAEPVEDPGTREALLEAGGAVFAEQGFRLARVRDIAARAGANVAAINYHFGGKQPFYEAVLQRTAERALQRFPMPAAAPDGPEAALRLAVRNILSRFLAQDEHARLPQLMMRELCDPTEALDHLVERVAKNQFLLLRAIVAPLLGVAPDSEHARLGAFSVLGQCLFYLFGQPMVARLAPEILRGDRVERLAAHIATFSIAGLKEMARHEP